MKYTNEDFPPGTVIRGTWSGGSERTIKKAEIRGDNLWWAQIEEKNEVDLTHSWELKYITIVEKSIANYEIY